MELEDHVPVYIPEPEHPEDLVPAEDEAHTPPLPPFFLSLRTSPLLPIPLPAPSTSCRADIPEADTPPRKRLLLTTPRPGCESWSTEGSRTAVRAEIEVLRRERLAYEQEGMETRQASARCNIVGHLVHNCRRPTNDNTTNNQRGTGISQKVNCYECGNQGHYRRDYPERKNPSHKNKIGGTGAHRVVHTLRGEETDQDPNNIKDGIKA
ncbi:putative reverse transcriptase domain, ribonuclease H-like domain, aspartic peptidase domain protein [Tanacetum coccineum]